MAQRPLVIIGLLGPRMDAYGTRAMKTGIHHAGRWDLWRPTLSLGQQDDLLVSRFELLHDGHHDQLLNLIVADYGLVSPATEVRPHSIPLEAPWDFERVYQSLHAWARNYPFDPDNEDYLVHITTGTHVAQICLFLLAESRHLPARLIQTSPPRARSAPSSWTIIDLDLSRYDQIAARFEEEKRDALQKLKAGIPTRNPEFNALIELIEKVALASSAPVLLLGPTGAGKSSLARRIHEARNAHRNEKRKLVEVNCATLRGDTAMSTLFGHRKGAFTGAVSDRSGLLMEAHEGALFLDEIGDLGLDEQAMLLHALEDGRFMPLGAQQEEESSFQLIAGTNRNLRAAVRQGKFRDDLLSRIDTWTFQLPGLRDRLEDLEPNLDYELALFAESHGRKVRFGAAARAQYLKFATSKSATWPGNFRDLNASITRLATLSAGGRITQPLVSAEIARLEASWEMSESSSDKARHNVLAEHLSSDDLDALDLFDQVQLSCVIEICREARSLSDAGRRLFAASRARKRSSNDADRLRKYLARFGLSWEDTQRR